MARIFIVMWIFPFTRSVKHPIKLSSIDSSQINKYKSFMPESSFSNLVNNIKKNKVSKMYFTKDMNNVVSLNTIQNGMIEDDYAITNINPIVTRDLTELSVTNKVETFFLLDPTHTTEKPVHNIAETLFTVFQYAIIFSLVISLLKMINLGRGGRNNGGIENMFKAFKMEKKNDTKKLKNNATLATFAGSPEIFEECTELVSFLRNNTVYKNAGAEAPRGVLLNGPPGTGKTLLAKVIAQEAHTNFIYTSASEFIELFVGAGSLKIRNLFHQARQNKPCIIFIDEIDAIGRQRSVNMGGMNNDERDQTLNQLLYEMDGFSDNDQILVMASTNRKDVLDSALLRPGRFDRIIHVPLPDKKSRIAILHTHTKNKNLDSSVNIDLIAELATGFSGAQLKNLLNEAAIFAARKGSTIINESFIMDALDKIVVGIVKKTDTRDTHAKRRVAIHEIGHAYLAHTFSDYFDFKKVSIQSTYNGAGGYTIFHEHANITESGMYTKALLFKRLVVGMGGKAAEYLYYGEEHVSVGANQDLKQANRLAQEMIQKYGMGHNLLETFYYDEERNNILSESIGEKLNEQSILLVSDAYRMAKTILNNNREKVDVLIEKLLEKTTIYGGDF
jgi:cell division protease FtsH